MNYNMKQFLMIYWVNILEFSGLGDEGSIFCDSWQVYINAAILSSKSGVPQGIGVFSDPLTHAILWSTVLLGYGLMT